MPQPLKSVLAGPATALVTGASSGIGQALATALVKAGCRVHGTSRDPHQPGRDTTLQWHRFDSSSPGGIDAFIKDEAELLEKIDILVNNAGASLFGDLAALPAEGPARQIRLLLEGPARLTRAVLPGMRARGRGAVVNISSLAAEFPLPYMALYSAGKAGLSALTRSLIITERAGGVQFIDCQPGDIRTAFNANMARREALSAAEERAWRRMEANLAAAPGAERAAGDVMRALRRGRSGVVRTGSWFQTCLAPLGMRILPVAILIWAIRRYYRLPRA